MISDIYRAELFDAVRIFAQYNTVSYSMMEYGVLWRGLLSYGVVVQSLLRKRLDMD